MLSRLPHFLKPYTRWCRAFATAHSLVHLEQHGSVFTAGPAPANPYTMQFSRCYCIFYHREEQPEMHRVKPQETRLTTGAGSPVASLVRAAQGGDLGAFDEIVGRFQDMAYASAYSMLGDAQLAEDAAQEAFLEAYLNLAKLHEPAAFPGWFRRIVFKQGDRLTRGKHIPTMPLENAFDMPLAELNPATVVERRETNLHVRTAIEELPDHERTVTLLFYSTGYALKDIAAFLEVPVTTIKKRLHDARKHLKETLVDVVRDTWHERRRSQMDVVPD